MPILRKSWTKQVGEVFNTLPRDGNKKSTVWLERKDLEQYMTYELESPGVSVCLDGPTGTGKSSLATTILNRMKIPFRLIQLTKRMAWTDFCYRIIKPPKTQANSTETSLEIGMNRGLPTALLKIVAGDKTNLDDYEIKKRLKDTITEDIVCELMAKNDVALLIDDFEKASNPILERVTGMCKLLTESFVSENGKVVIVGTDDIYSRITQEDISLEDRLTQISIGTFASKLDSWNFMRLGFEKLKLENPVSLCNKGFISKDDLSDCVNAVYEAADGLPKRLNVLGRDIARNASYKRRRISVSDVIQTANKVPTKDIKKYSSEYPMIMQAAKDPIVSLILKYLYQKGVGQIHKLGDIIESLKDSTNEKQVRHGIGVLISLNFLTQTGYNKDVLFVRNPAFAHTIGVVIASPEKYNAPKQLTKNNCQLSLPFYCELGDKR